VPVRPFAEMMPDARQMGPRIASTASFALKTPQKLQAAMQHQSPLLLLGTFVATKSDFEAA